jgi:hypothetical protein
VDRYAYTSDQRPTIYAIRYAGVEPVTIAMIALTFFPQFEPYRQRATAFWVLSVGVFFISISYVSTTPNHGIYMARHTSSLSSSLALARARPHAYSHCTSPLFVSRCASPSLTLCPVS